MGTIAINNLSIAKMPNSCKECPLTYLDPGDDAYFGAYERRCVFDDSCVDGMVSERAYDCPLVEAISKDQYEARLKAEKIAMLKELKSYIELMASLETDPPFAEGEKYCAEIIQQEIDKLKENKDEK